ncbi:hypothetical protein CI105_03875 [Candidatus Izimaplasma bacterium ZiA1]|uniref:hypothetical protein n=1 Tax=Candidatus Izimoplasma sp. ZiA1 TaxID=2024899 RepID=UPI000BAA3E85|nr:hypothetical protein CI105_03875 [Candidatus Izimaplasma bacterium ZiA1]
MLSKKNLSVIDWLVIYVLLIIPFVNVVFILYALLSSKTNATFKNMIIAYILIAVIGIVLWFGVFAAAFASTFN